MNLLRSVSLLVLASAALSAQAFDYTGGGSPIPDRSTQTSTISGVGPILRVDSVTIRGFDHSYIGDLVVTLTGPNGATVDLLREVPYLTNLNGNYTFAVGGSDLLAAVEATGNDGTLAAGTYAPSGQGGTTPTDYSAFDGSMGGAFTLRIRDLSSFDEGGFEGWTLSVTPQSAPSVPGPLAALPFALIALNRRRKRA